MANKYLESMRSMCTGKCIDNGEWVEGYVSILIGRENDQYMIVERDGDVLYPHIVHEESIRPIVYVAQKWPGGGYIAEGDIITFVYHGKELAGQVCWDDDGCKAVIKTKDISVDFSELDLEDGDKENSFYCVETNIYDNPDKKIV